MENDLADEDLDLDDDGDGSDLVAGEANQSNDALESDDIESIRNIGE